MLSRLKKMLSQEQHRISPGDAKQFMDARLGKDIIAAKGRLKAGIENVMGEYSGLRKLYAELAERDARMEFPNSVKAKLCKRALDLLDVQEPHANYKALTVFLGASQENLRSIGALSYKEMIHLYAFREDMNRIAGRTKALIESLNRLAEELDRSLLKKIDSAESCAGRIDAGKARREDLVLRIGSLQKLAEEKRELLKDEIKSLKEFSSIEEEMKRLKEKIGEAESGMRFLDSKISEQFSGCEKLFRKYKHANRRKGVIDSYIGDATKAFLDIDEGMEIRDILDGMAEHQEFRDEKKFGNVARLRRDLDMLSSFREEYRSLKVKKDGAEDDMLKLSSRASDKRYRLEDIEAAESEIRELEKEVEEREKEVTAADEAIRSDMQQLAVLLSSFTGERIMVSED